MTQQRCGSTFNFARNLVQTPITSFGALGQVGCNITLQNDGTVKADFTESVMGRGDVKGYTFADGISTKDMTVREDPNSNGLIFTPQSNNKLDVRDVGARIAAIAVKKGDKLGLAFEKHVTEHPQATIINTVCYAPTCGG